MPIDDHIQKGQQAERLLNDPLLQEAFEAVEMAYIKQMKKIPLTPKEYQENSKYRDSLMLGLQTVNKVQELLNGYIANGEIQERNLEEKKPMFPKIARLTS